MSNKVFLVHNRFDFPAGIFSTFDNAKNFLAKKTYDDPEYTKLNSDNYAYITEYNVDEDQNDDCSTVVYEYGCFCFKPEYVEFFNVQGRGVLVSVDARSLKDYYKINVGDHIMIGSDKYKVCGIEMTTHLMYPTTTPKKYGMNVKKVESDC